jgi:phosphonate transport system ATP-binding protein
MRYHVNRHHVHRRDALRLVDAEVVYPNGARALHPLSLAFEQGAFSVLLGPSGAGKSTLLRALNGLVHVTAGHVETSELGPLRSSSAWRRHRRATGMVFQQHQLIGRLSAFQNVCMGRLGHHSALRSFLPLSRAEKIIALEALERVGLLNFALRRVDQLSGGQQQRVGIARALTQQPTLMLADEPVASLDPATALRVMTLLHDICRQDGLTAVVSLHQVDLARRFADRIVGIAGGRIVFDGPPAALDEAVVSRIYGGSSFAAPLETANKEIVA